MGFEEGTSVSRLGALRAPVALVAVVGCLGFAVSDSFGADWDSARPVDASVLFSDPAFGRAMVDATVAEQRRQAERQTAAEREERGDSRDAFVGLAPSEAQDLAQESFPELMGADLDALGLPHGVTVRKFLAPDVAQLVNGDGKQSLLIGTLPFATPDASGELQPVDLSLADAGNHFAPESAAADVTIPETSTGFTRFADSGLGLRPEDAAATAGVEQDDRVFYADVASDTDFVSMPTRDGAEVLWQLRSAEAGGELSLDVDLPDGASMRLASAITAPVGQTVSPDGAGVQVLARDGSVIDTISPPRAQDADGVTVDASYEVDGDQLIVHVAHQQADVKYPVLVDPEVHEVEGGADLCSSHGGWTYQTWGGAMMPYCNHPYWGAGLFIQSYTAFYNNTDRSQFVWPTPAYVHIISAWLDGMYAVAAGTHWYGGIAGPYGWESLFNYGGDLTNGNYTFVANPGNDTNEVAFGLYMDGGWQRPHPGLAGIAGANIRVGDYYKPTVALHSIPATPLDFTWAGLKATRWIDGKDKNPAVTAYVDGTDAGLGLKEVAVMPVTRDAWTGHTLMNCAGYRSSPCPHNGTWAETLDFQQRKGMVQLQTVATDITDNTAEGPAWFQRIDRDLPTIAFSGPVADHRTDNTLGPGAVLHVYAADGSNTTASTYQSGVRKVQLQVDGTTMPPWTNPNVDTTNNDFGWDYALPVATNGTHTVHVTAWDDVGHIRTADLTFVSNPYPTSYQHGGANRSVDTPAEINAVVELLQTASDVAANQIWAGLAPDDALAVFSAWSGDPLSDACAGSGSGSFACTGEITGGADFPATSYAVNAGNCSRYSAKSLPLQGATSGAYPSIWNWQQSWKLWTQVPEDFGPPLTEILNVVNHTAKIVFNGIGVTVTAGAQLLCGPGLKFVTSVKFTALNDRSGPSVTDVETLSSSGYVNNFSRSYTTQLHQDRYQIAFSNTIYEKEGAVAIRHPGPRATSYTISCGDNGSGQRVCWFEVP